MQAFSNFHASLIYQYCTSEIEVQWSGALEGMYGTFGYNTLILESVYTLSAVSCGMNTFFLH